MCTTHLWNLSHSLEICPELLEKHLLCITYGQPLIDVPRANVSDVVIGERFHAIFCIEDNVPRIMQYLNASNLKFAVHWMPERHLKSMDLNMVSIALSILKTS